MHLIKGQGGHMQTSFYQNSTVLTRPDTLPYIFRKLRTHRNLTKRRIAEKFSVSEGYVRDIENGQKFPSLRYCLKCADEYGANPGWVKSKWAKEAIKRFTDRLNQKLGLEN